MLTQILATKLYIPVPRPGSVMRPRLIDRLNAELHGNLTLISAPAGFGKTTLVTEWIAADERQAAWLSLDDGDSDPVRFLTYIVAALQTIETEIGAGILNLLESPQPPPIDSLLTPLLNELAAIQQNFVLVLDDYHALDSSQIDAALAFLIDNQPPQMHLVITTREDPRLPLARLRVRGQLNEIRAADLRFTTDEAADFLNSMMGLNLSSGDIAALEQRTEGWIAGLQLAAISMQGQPDPHTFVQSFTGSHRFIVDYLVDEVLNQQPDAVRDFLFQTSILDRLSASLCDAVTGQDDGQTMLEQLEQSNMLIVPLDDQRQWYRYHHLFGEVLQTYARKAAPDKVSVWQKRASLWCEKNGFRSDAIRYAFAADDLAHVADLVERTWPEMFYGVRPMTWLDWAQKLPEEAVRVRPVLSAACAWMLLDKGELAAAEAHLQNVTQWLQRINTSGQSEAKRLGMIVANEAEFHSLPGSTASAYGYLAQNYGDVQMTIDHSKRALSLLSDDAYFWRGGCALFLGLAQWSSGDLNTAHTSMRESVDNQRKSGSHYFETFGTAIMGDIRAAQGRLHDAYLHYQQALALVSVDAVDPDNRTVPRRKVIQGPVALYVGLAELFREWDDLETAAHYLQFGQEVVGRAILPGSAYRLWCTMARLQVAQGKFDLALDYLHEAERVYQPAAVPDIYPIDALRARVWLHQGQVKQASDWVRQRKLSVDDDLSYLNAFVYLTFARILIEQEKTRQNNQAIIDALHLLDRLLLMANQSGINGIIIEAAVLQAVAHQARGNTDFALEHLEHALALAESEGYIRVFVDEGEAIQPLLARCLSQGNHVDYVKKLLDRLQPQGTGESPNQLLIEPLSERELEVLNLMANGHTNQAIADDLFIALSTVKKHINNIYGKLNVPNRTQAINRARDLGILS